MQAGGKSFLPSLIHKISGLNTADALKLLADEFPGKIVFSSSFSYEDQVISYEILNNHIPIDIFTLDTGRLFAETYSVWSNTNQKYNTSVRGYYPQALPLQNFVEEKGPNSFYESVENRKQCCYIRKVEPLQRALAGQQVWVTGLRAAHSASRENLPQLEWDENNQLIKFHPLLYFTTEQLMQQIRKHNIPYNALHDKGFVSIGCAPCTRAVKPGEDFRAGRWWWEDTGKKECGLHSAS